MSSCAKCIALVLAVLAVSLYIGCAKPPTEEIDAAKAAIESAKLAGAEEYAPDELKAATDKLAEAEEKVNMKDYEAAKSLAKEAEEKAKLAAEVAPVNKEKVKEELEKNILPALEKDYAALKKLEAQAKANKKVEEAIKSTLDEIANIDAEKGDIKSAFDGGRYKEAKDKAEALKAKIDDTCKIIKDELAKAAAAKAPAPKPKAPAPKKKK